MSGNGPIQIGDVIEVFGGEVKSADELIAEGQKETPGTMPGEIVLSTEGVKTKLRQGGFSSGHVDEFCRLLADRLNPEIVPLGFLMAYELLIMDVERGVDGFTGKKIESYIAGLGIGGVYRLVMTSIIKKVLPEDFAAQVLKEWQGVLEDSRAAR